MMNRRRAIDSVQAATEEGMVASELPSVNRWISTGCTLLDLAISNKIDGGVPVGRITHIFGAESTCKTVLGMTILGSAQRCGAIAFFADVENTFDPTWAKLFGLDCSDKDTWRIGYPRTIENLFDDYLKSIVELDDDRPKVVVIDTLSAMPSEVEIETNLKDGTYGMSRAKQLSAGFRKYIMPIAKSNISLIFIDQTRDNVGVMFGDREVTSGGRALKFYSSVRLHLFSGVKIKNKKDKDVGIWVNFRIDKNKVSFPYRNGCFKILWDYGIDNTATCLEFLKENQVDGEEKHDGRKGKRKSGRVEFDGMKKFMNDMILHVEDNDLEDRLAQEVADLWLDIYKPEERRKRKWR